jgi:hypothetical protein
VDNWKKVVSSDEMMISRVRTFGKTNYYSRIHHHQFHSHQAQQTIQGGGGKMMLWGCTTFCLVLGMHAGTMGKGNSDVSFKVVQDYVQQSL